MGKEITVKELKEMGANIGHIRSFLHPSFRSFVEFIDNKMVYIDLNKTVEQLKKVKAFLEKEKDALILWVGTKIVVKDLIEEIGKKLEHPYVKERWLGGMLTNFETLKRSLKRFEELKKGEKTKKFKEMTKKEKRILKQKREKLEKFLDGLKNLNDLPKIMIIVDPFYEKTAVKEARKKGIKIIGLCDVNADISKIDMPIPVNDESRNTLKKILESLAKVFDKGFSFKNKK